MKFSTDNSTVIQMLSQSFSTGSMLLYSYCIYSMHRPLRQHMDFLDKTASAHFGEVEMIRKAHLKKLDKILS
jgi:hypothetical protein